MAMSKEERKARIEILNKLLVDDRDRLEASTVLAAMVELYTLVHMKISFMVGMIFNARSQTSAHTALWLSMRVVMMISWKEPIGYCGQHLQQILKWLKILRPLKGI